jgi:16S rRNA (guanine966-N2)-methyltransferase
MKIIAGKHRGRNIKTNLNKNYRPTTARTREGLFSILSSGRFIEEDGKTIINGATIIDLCCGTGALGLEALSRGAARVVAIDIEQDNLNLLKENAVKFGEIDNISLIRADAAMLPKAKIQSNLVFIDPPYNQQLVGKSLISLMNQGWLTNNAWVIVEIGKKEKLEVPAKYEIIDERLYGKTKIVIILFKDIRDEE